LEAPPAVLLEVEPANPTPALGPKRPPQRPGLGPLPWIIGGAAVLGVLMCAGVGLVVAVLTIGRTANPPFATVGASLGKGPGDVAPFEFAPVDEPNRPQLVLPPAPGPMKPPVLAGAGVSRDWQVLFRSHDPRIWDRDVRESDMHQARPVHTAPADARFLRVRRDSDYVILEVTKEKLGDVSNNGRYGWNGSNGFQWGGFHLGIFDRKLSGGKKGEICVFDGPPASGWGFGHIAYVDDRQAYCWAGAPVEPYIVEIAVKGGELTPQESAKLLRRVVTAPPIKPAKLEGNGVSKDWEVIFCSADPGAWDRDVQQGPNHFAKPLRRVPQNIRYLRLRKDADYVIVPVAVDRLAQATAKGGYGWNGTNHDEYAGRHLGIFSADLPARERGDILIHSSSGWGFGHIHFVGDDQGYSWQGRPLPPTVFEIAVKTTELTPEEDEKLLHRVVRTEPIKPEKLVGPHLSKDWNVLFCSADPTIWDQDVQRGASHFAKPLKTVQAPVDWLRLRKDGDYVILKMTAERLHDLGDEGGRYGWSGRGEEDSGAIHLGIYDKENRCKAGDICVRSGPWCQGWGFGHIHFKANLQGYCWGGEPTTPCVFEIAVKRGPLTAEEAKRVLKVGKE
jgi:hypothetical protein